MPSYFKITFILYQIYSFFTMKISLYFLYKYTFLLRPKNVHIKGQLGLLIKESQLTFLYFAYLL